MEEPIQTISDEQLREVWSASTCAACESTKTRSEAFCKSCTLALQMWQRAWLREGPASERFATTYNAALQHLRIWRDKIKRLASVRSGWSFSSIEELEAAGYTLLNVGRCRAIGCNQEIGWIESSTGARIPVNLSDYQPHRTTCKNPGEYRKKKTVQASARKQRGRGRR